MGLLDWVKKKSVEREQKNILRNLRFLGDTAAVLEREIIASGGSPVTSGPAFEELMRLRKQLYNEILLGPMTPAEVREFVTPHADGASKGFQLALNATLDQAEKDDQR